MEMESINGSINKKRVRACKFIVHNFSSPFETFRVINSHMYQKV